MTPIEQAAFDYGSRCGGLEAYLRNQEITYGELKEGVSDALYDFGKRFVNILMSEILTKVVLREALTITGEIRPLT